MLPWRPDCRTWRILGHDALATVCCERAKSPPFGIAGGSAGAPARIAVTRQVERAEQQKVFSPGRFARDI